MLESAIRNAQRELVARQEAYLLEFFGSYENAERFGHLYVFEADPIELVESGDVGSYSIRQEFRLRIKTAEELATEHERESSGAGDE